MLKRMAIVAALACFAGPAYPQNKPAEHPRAQVAPKSRAAQEIFACLAPGLPKDWRRTWVTVKELESSGEARHFEADFRYARSAKDLKGTPLAGLGCAQATLAKKILDLNKYLAPDKRHWSRATLAYTTDGKGDIRFDFRYEYRARHKE